MIPAIFKLGPIVLSTFGFFAVIAFIVFSFILWRILKEDYREEEILTFTIFVALVGLAGARIGFCLFNFEEFVSPWKWVLFNRFPGFSFLTGILASMAAIFWWVRKRSWDFWLLADSATFASLWGFGFAGIGLFLSNGALKDLYRIFLIVFTLGLAHIFAKRYRKFIWYKSGKLGFVACSTTAIFFAGYFFLDFLTKTAIYWESVLALFLAILALGFLYQRSERKIKEDLRGLALGIRQRARRPK